MPKEAVPCAQATAQTQLACLCGISQLPVTSVLKSAAAVPDLSPGFSDAGELTRDRTIDELGR